MDMKNTTRNILIGFALAVGVLALLAAVPSQTDFDGTYFKTNTLPISLVGNLVNWQQRATNTFSSHWVDSGTSDATLAGTATVGGSILPRAGFGRVAVASNHTITTNELYLVVTSPCQLTFPAANAVPAGHLIIIKDLSGGITTNTPAGADTFDSVAESDYLTLKSSLQYVSDGTSNWERN